MFFIIFFILLLMLLSAMMMINPDYFSASIIAFSQKWYFHWFEVISRLLVGIIFIVYAPDVSFSNLLFVIGVVFIFISISLLFLGEKLHRKFALWSVKKFNKIFRSAGMVSFIFAGYLLYNLVV